MIDLKELTIGKTKEQKLKPKRVIIKDIEIQELPNFKPRIIIKCKHPDQEELISIQKVTRKKNEKITTTGLWLNIDKDNKINPYSEIAHLMKELKAETILELIDKEIETTTNEEQYLTIKLW